jgi:hypothetical protein
LSLSAQKYGFEIRDPDGFGIRKKPIPDPGSRGSKRHRIPYPDPQHWKAPMKCQIPAHSRLFACYNDGIINLLEKYFEMNKKQAREALDLYKLFLLRNPHHSIPVL